MIKQPDSDLAKKLQAIEAKTREPGADEAEIAFEHDTVLASAWKQLTGEAKDALDILLSRLEAQAVHTLQTPNQTNESRQFAAGQLNIVYQIQANLTHFVTFTPKKEDYASQFGPPEDNETDRKIVY